MLVNLNDLLREAVKSDFVVPCFTVYGQVDTKAIIKAAEYIQGPVIIAASCKLVECMGVANAAHMIRGLAGEVKVPVCAHLDYGFPKDVIISAIYHGFSSVAFDGSSLSLEDNIQQTRKIAQAAHGKCVSIEGSIASLDPYEAEALIRDGELDALAIKVDAELQDLHEIADRIEVPLVALNVKDNQKYLNAGLFGKLNLGPVLSQKYANEIRIKTQGASAGNQSKTVIDEVSPIIEESACKLLRLFYKPVTTLQDEQQPIWSFPYRDS